MWTLLQPPSVNSSTEYTKLAAKDAKPTLHFLIWVRNSLSNLYKKIMLPSLLYGSELWKYMVFSDRAQLNTLQHCKKSLSLPKSFRSDMCESLFDTLPIVAEIDARKLLFVGRVRLCRLSRNTLTKSIFLTRLLSYLHYLSNNQLGFIPDVMKISPIIWPSTSISFMDISRRRIFSQKTYL